MPGSIPAGAAAIAKCAQCAGFKPDYRDLFNKHVFLLNGSR